MDIQGLTKTIKVKDAMLAKRIKEIQALQETNEKKVAAIFSNGRRNEAVKGFQTDANSK
jgi:hypothetical protein